jgi:beta-lactamase regulating signal transducer with metallopeptidase domain
MALVNALLATMLALTAWTVGRWGRLAGLSHALWLLVFLKLVTPPLLPINMPWPLESAATLAEEPMLTSEADSAADLLISNAELAEPSSASTPAPERRHVIVQPLRPAGISWAVGSWRSLWQPALLTIWCAGTFLFWIVAGYRLALLRRLLRHAEPASLPLQAQVIQLAQRLGVARPPGVWLVPMQIPPVLWAVLGSPRLLLPRALWEQLGAEQRRTLLVHELLHLRGGDHWVRRLELLALGLYWWHPVAWWARLELRELEEQRCDAGVVAQLPAARADYAQTLLDTVAFLSRARSAAPVGASSMGQVRVLKRRLTMILHGSTSSTWSRRGAWLVLGLGALLLPWMPTWAQSQPKPAPQQPDRGTAQTGQPESPLRNLAERNFAAYLNAVGQALPRRSKEASRDDLDARLADLEEKLAALQKEIQNLRRERGAKRSFSLIDLQSWSNQPLNESFHSGQYEGNNLASLPQGEQTLGSVPFRIGKQLVQLGSRINRPDKVESIKVGRKLSKLNILHATGYIADDGTEIAQYTIHYEDGTTATIPVVYGEDVLDWWKYPFSGEPTRGKVVWNGENEPAKREFDATLRLYMTTWDNPKPDVRISSIDYAVAGDTQCVPFCVAMTGESK